MKRKRKAVYYNPFLVYCRELAPGTVSLTGDRAQGDDSKHDSHYTINYFQSKHMATYVVGTQKTRLNETFLLSAHVGQHFSPKTMLSGQVSLIYFAQAVRIINAEDRAQMNRELSYLFYGKWKIGFLARQSDTAARCGHGFHNRSSLNRVSDVWPRD